jgi:hypothetical protein
MKYLIKKDEKKYILILFLIIFFIFFIIYYNIFFKEKEGFDINEIDNMFDDVKNVTRVVEEVPQKINNIKTELKDQVKLVEEKTEQKLQQIEEKIINLVTIKIRNVFIQLGDIFKNGIVNPILSVFTGIGQIFKQVFNILKEIANKIVSLPNCIFTYVIASTLDSIYFFYEKITPTFISNIFSSIYYYTLRYLFNFIGYITGYDDNYNKCYGFNVSSEVDKITSKLDNIQLSFINDFGDLKFSQIKF